MNILSVSRGDLDLVRIPLSKSSLTLGRSPACDAVLRAAGIAPVHFLIERVDGGEAEDLLGEWSVVDISRGIDGPSEGRLLNEDGINFENFHFVIESDALEARPEIGGGIQERLDQEQIRKLPSLPIQGAQSRYLEIAHIRADSGAVEELIHLEAPSGRRATRPLRLAPQMEVLWDATAKEVPVRILLRQVPGAKIWSRQGATTDSGQFALSWSDLARVTWKGDDFYFRFVPKVPVPPTPKMVIEDSVFAALLGWIFLPLFVIILARAWFHTEPELPIVPPPRVATVEVKAPIEVKPEPLPQPPPPAPVTSQAPAPEPPKALAAGLDVPKSPEKAAAAAAARFTAKPTERPKAGLNSPAKSTDINRVGILGALAKSKGAAKGPGVRPDLVLNDGIKTDAVSGAENSAARITLQNPPTGALGSGHGGARGTEEGPDLSEASTTLSGVGEPDPSSMGPIARKGGQGKGMGAALGGDGTGIGSGSPFGTLGDGGGMSATGGLDRETVRRVIGGYRGRIRTCYEQALMRKPKLQGRVVIKWTISPTGPVRVADRQSSTIGDGTLEACVLEIVRAMSFPAAANKQPTVVIYPFAFETKR